MISLKDGVITYFKFPQQQSWYLAYLVDDQMFIDNVKNHKDVLKGLSDSYQTATDLRGIGPSVY